MNFVARAVINSGSAKVHGLDAKLIRYVLAPGSLPASFELRTHHETETQKADEFKETASSRGLITGDVVEQRPELGDGRLPKDGLHAGAPHRIPRRSMNAIQTLGFFMPTCSASMRSTAWSA